MIDYAELIKVLQHGQGRTKRLSSTVSIHARLPAIVVDAIDSMAKQQNVTRSVIFREILLEYFERKVSGLGLR